MANRILYLRWIGANSIGELLGLGLTFAIGYGVVAIFGEMPGLIGTVISALLMTASGMVEGVIVGWAQWWALHPAFPAINRRSWVGATVAGALVAWFFGSLPFTLINATSGVESTGGAAAAPPAEPAQWMVLLLAAGVGAVAGVILAAFQAFVLRRYVSAAGSWLVANALAWAAGMVTIFAAMDIVFSGIPVYLAVLTFALTLLVTGAIVGAVHGVFLVRLRSQQVSGGETING